MIYQNRDKTNLSNKKEEIDMNKQVNVKQGTIVCQVCGKVIENVDNSEGVKTWYGKCSEDCSRK
ncbi:GapA-binding peptide SR1P [Priestia megaterium]